MVFATLFALIASGLDPELVVVNARVRTMDARATVAEAFAVRDGRIAAVGTSNDIRALAGPTTRIIDALGRTVLPGFNDSPVHFISGGLQLSRVELTGEPTGVLKDAAMDLVFKVVPAATTHAFRSPLDAGATLAFGSDWTVAPLDPLKGIHSAVTRQTIDGKHPDGWIPAQKITVEEAVRAYTAGSAYAEFMETEKGTLEPGRLADFVILSCDIFTNASAAILQTKAVLTAVAGRVVYEPSDSALTPY